jgi:hypothetical protein
MSGVILLKGLAMATLFSDRNRPKTLSYDSSGVEGSGPKSRVPWLMFGGFITVCLISVILPALGHRACGCASSRVKCSVNEHQIMSALVTDAQSHGGFLPPTLKTLQDAAPESLKDIYRCPEGTGSYIYLGDSLHLASLPKETVLLYEPPGNHKDPKTDEPAMHVLRADGSVNMIIGKEAQTMLSELSAGYNPPRNGMGVR